MLGRQARLTNAEAQRRLADEGYYEFLPASSEAWIYLSMTRLMIRP